MRTQRQLWILTITLGLLFIGLGHARIDIETVAGMWLFDENSGDTAKDISGNENHGTLIGDPEWVPGVFGSAVEFDGDDYVDCGNSETLSMEDEVTVMFWVRTDKVMKDMWADRQVVVGKHYLEYEVGIYMQGQIHTYTNDGSGANYDEGIMVSMAGKLPDKENEWETDKWYHIAWTLNQQHEMAYVNGILIGEFDKAHEGTRPGNHPLEIGRRVEGSLPVSGAVDEVAVFSVALDEEDILIAFERGLASAVGLAPVDPSDKLATTWADVRSR